MSARPAAVVFGATGNQGSNVVKHLYAAGWADIYCVTRNPADARPQQVFPGIKLLQGDLEDKKCFEINPLVQESLAAAMRGPRTPGSSRRVVVFAMSTPSLASTGGTVDAEREVFTGCSLIDAAQETNVDHVVFSSVCGCDKESAPSYHRSKLKIEEKLKKSGLSYSILRPVSFLEIWARLSQFSNKSISGLTKGDVKQQWVALDDVGACAALALQHAKYKGRTIDLCGDELTGNDMAKTLTKLRAGSTGEMIVYKCAWFMRLFMMCLVGTIYQEKVEFQEKGGFAADRTGLRDFSDDYPEEFKRKGPMDFEKFLVRYGFEDRPLPAERGWGKMLVLLVCGIAAVAGLLVVLLPTALLQDLQRRWAFYGFGALLALGVVNKLVCKLRG